MSRPGDKPEVSRALDARVICTYDFASWEQPLTGGRGSSSRFSTPLSRNESGRYQRPDWDARQLAEWHEVPVATVLVLEGVSASRAAFALYPALRV